MDAIFIEDSEAEVSPPPAKNFLVSTHGDNDILCEFPVGKSPNVALTLRDYRTLGQGEFLNDIIIDFFLTWLHQAVLPVREQSHVYIFPTMFYHRLVTTPSKVAMENSFEKDPGLSEAKKRHLRVKGWTKKVNIFQENMVIIPICEHSHWYLIIVVNLETVEQLEGIDEDGGEERREPFLLVLDSLGGGEPAAVEVIKDFLSMEWQVQVSVSDESLGIDNLIILQTPL